MHKNNEDYKWNVFINCPFDKEYKELFDAIIFTIMDCGYTPKCALENDDGSEIRIQKISKIIKSCKLAIHDISRIELSPTKGLPRFNMPLELGLFLGIKFSGNKKQEDKSCLILDSEQYRYQIFLSDIAGQDIRSHGNDPSKVISIVRDWLSSQNKEVSYPGGKAISNRYFLFRFDLPKICKELNLSIEDLTFIDYLKTIYEWIKLEENSISRRWI